MARVWMYWEYRNRARVRPAYLDLCLETIRRHLGPLTLELVDRENVFEWLPDLDADTWHRLPEATFRSDYCRTLLMHRYGGLYLDYDCIALEGLDTLLEPLATHEFAGWGAEAEGRLYNNLFAARPGARLLEEWIEAQDAVLRASDDWDSLPRAVLGMHLAAPLAARLEHYNFPLPTIAPVMWYEWRRFFSRTASPVPVLAQRPRTVMLWNGFMAPPLRTVSEQQLRRGRTLLCRLLRIGLGESTLEEELDAWTRLHLISDIRFSSLSRKVERRLHA